MEEAWCCSELKPFPCLLFWQEKNMNLLTKSIHKTSWKVQISGPVSREHTASSCRTSLDRAGLCWGNLYGLSHIYPPNFLRQFKVEPAKTADIPWRKTTFSPHSPLVMFLPGPAQKPWLWGPRVQPSSQAMSSWSLEPSWSHGSKLGLITEKCSNSSRFTRVETPLY